MSESGTMANSYGQGGSSFHCIQMTRGSRKWNDQLETPNDRRERLRKIHMKRKEGRDRDNDRT